MRPNKRKPKKARIAPKTYRPYTVGEYRKYRKGAEWQVIREEKLKETPNCERCGTNENLTIHHIWYPMILGTEPLEWLQVFCWPCHKKKHKELEILRLEKRRENFLMRLYELEQKNISNDEMLNSSKENLLRSLASTEEWLEKYRSDLNQKE